MERRTAVILVIFGTMLLLSCNNTTNEYSLRIFKASIKNNTQSEKTKIFQSSNDSTAFKTAIQSYWIEKIITQRSNEQNASKGYDVEVEVPYSFILFKIDDKDSLMIDFDSAYATNIAKPIIDSLKIQIPKYFDERDSVANNQPRANIY